MLTEPAESEFWGLQFARFDFRANVLEHSVLCCFINTYVNAPNQKTAKSSALITLDDH